MKENCGKPSARAAAVFTLVAGRCRALTAPVHWPTRDRKAYGACERQSHRAGALLRWKETLRHDRRACGATCEEGKPKVIAKTRIHRLRSRPIVGLQVVSGMRPAGPNRWKGYIYNADDGGTYPSELRLSGNAMNLKGCWGPFCKKNRFIRAPLVL